MDLITSPVKTLNLSRTRFKSDATFSFLNSTNMGISHMGPNSPPFRSYDFMKQIIDHAYDVRTTKRRVTLEQILDSYKAVFSTNGFDPLSDTFYYRMILRMDQSSLRTWRERLEAFRFVIEGKPAAINHYFKTLLKKSFKGWVKVALPQRRNTGINFRKRLSIVDSTLSIGDLDVSSIPERIPSTQGRTQRVLSFDANTIPADTTPRIIMPALEPVGSESKTYVPPSVLKSTRLRASVLSQTTTIEKEFLRTVLMKWRDNTIPSPEEEILVRDFRKKHTGIQVGKHIRLMAQLMTAHDAVSVMVNRRTVKKYISQWRVMIFGTTHSDVTDLMREKFECLRCICALQYDDDLDDTSALCIKKQFFKGLRAINTKVDRLNETVENYMYDKKVSILRNAISKTKKLFRTKLKTIDQSIDEFTDFKTVSFIQRWRSNANRLSLLSQKWDKNAINVERNVKRSTVAHMFDAYSKLVKQQKKSEDHHTRNVKKRVFHRYRSIFARRTRINTLCSEAIAAKEQKSLKKAMDTMHATFNYTINLNSTALVHIVEHQCAIKANSVYLWRLANTERLVCLHLSQYRKQNVVNMWKEERKERNKATNAAVHVRIRVWREKTKKEKLIRTFRTSHILKHWKSARRAAIAKKRAKLSAVITHMRGVHEGILKNQRTAQRFRQNLIKKTTRSALSAWNVSYNDKMTDRKRCAVADRFYSETLLTRTVSVMMDVYYTGQKLRYITVRHNQRLAARAFQSLKIAVHQGYALRIAFLRIRRRIYFAKCFKKWQRVRNVLSSQLEKQHIARRKQVLNMLINEHMHRRVRGFVAFERHRLLKNAFCALQKNVRICHDVSARCNELVRKIDSKDFVTINRCRKFITMLTKPELFLIFFEWRKQARISHDLACLEAAADNYYRRTAVSSSISTWRLRLRYSRFETSIAVFRDLYLKTRVVAQIKAITQFNEYLRDLETLSRVQYMKQFVPLIRGWKTQAVKQKELSRVALAYRQKQYHVSMGNVINTWRTHLANVNEINDVCGVFLRVKYEETIRYHIHNWQLEARLVDHLKQQPGRLKNRTIETWRLLTFQKIEYAGLESQVRDKYNSRVLHNALGCWRAALSDEQDVDFFQTYLRERAVAAVIRQWRSLNMAAQYESELAVTADAALKSNVLSRTIASWKAAVTQKAVLKKLRKIHSKIVKGDHFRLWRAIIAKRREMQKKHDKLIASFRRRRLFNYYRIWRDFYVAKTTLDRIRLRGAIKTWKKSVEFTVKMTKVCDYLRDFSMKLHRPYFVHWRALSSLFTELVRIERQIRHKRERKILSDTFATMMSKRSAIVRSRDAADLFYTNRVKEGMMDFLNKHLRLRKIWINSVVQWRCMTRLKQKITASNRVLLKSAMANWNTDTVSIMGAVRHNDRQIMQRAFTSFKYMVVKGRHEHEIKKRIFKTFMQLRELSHLGGRLKKLADKYRRISLKRRSIYLIKRAYRMRHRQLILDVFCAWKSVTTFKKGKRARKKRIYDFIAKMDKKRRDERKRLAFESFRIRVQMRKQKNQRRASRVSTRSKRNK
ncbi:hypothetical protein PCE1_001284 [Barthelona sp. PCE]